MSDFSVQAFTNNLSHIDRIPSVRGMILGPDSFTFDVRTNDVENNGETFGVAEDNDFFVTIHDARAVPRPDLSIGSKPALTTMRGDNRYNTNSTGQKVGIRTRKSGAARIHFVAENDGNTTDSLRIRGIAGKGLKRLRCFRITGGRQNVSAAFRASGHLAEGLQPGTKWRYEAGAAMSPRLPQRRSQLRILARPGSLEAPLDANLALIRRR